MELLDHVVNRRIMNGNFPVEKLYPANKEINPIDFEAESKMGMAVFIESPEFLNIMIRTFSQKVKELDSIGDSKYYFQRVNYYINTRYSADILENDKIGQKVNDLKPVVTPLDKVLWYGAFVYEKWMEFEEISKPESKNMMYAWIKMLDLAQDMELQTGRTIDVNKIDFSDDILDIIHSGFKYSSSHVYTRRLSDLEINDLKRLFEQRKALFNEIKDKHRIEKEVADKTQEQWNVFLEIINDLSEKEAEVIQRINKSVSAKDKLKAIYDYTYIVTRLKNHKYELGKKEIFLPKVYYAVFERLQNASMYATASIDNGKPFILNPAIIQLAINPLTFNFIFMMYHQFRLKPNKDNAKQFVSLALESIKNNLCGEKSNNCSLDEMIADFYNTINGFMTKNKSTIENLSFSKLQSNAVMVNGISSEYADRADLNSESLTEKINSVRNSNNYEEALMKIAEGHIFKLSQEEIIRQLKEVDSDNERIEKEVTARKLIYSLNTIYLFCDALRIMTSNKHSNIKIKNIENIKKYRTYLLNLDDRLVHKVYADLDEQEIGMLEYREKSGIIATSLSEQEVEEEKYRNSLFSNVFKDTITSLIEGLDKQDSVKILKIKTNIRKEILCFPECDEKELYADWLDSISYTISMKLVNNSKKQIDKYTSIKETIKLSLGILSEKLPSSTLDSLTTAEMLYEQYACESFASKGFDFSCISALYYQAFEDAYNDLIWKDYAIELNGLEINGQKYVDILKNNKNNTINDPPAQGYLDSKPTQRKYYLNYSPNTTVSPRCMYKSFAILMENICNPSKLPHFCEYFAKKTGYSGIYEMFNDISFMNKCKEFTDAVSRSADNRNNASHGGSYISVIQCTDDKKRVINDLETVRNNSIGLIQQLLYLLHKS
ncbi:MAG: hypothetical protein IKH75_06190 [Ruminococcus sp.]|nr:hypothetical protein [Ruminococcus sp.]